MILHKGTIVKVDQLSYYTSYPNSIRSVRFVRKPIAPYEEVCVGLLKE